MCVYRFHKLPYTECILFICCLSSLLCQVGGQSTSKAESLWSEISSIAFILVLSSYSLNIRHTDVLTVFDGRDLMSHVIGQYLGSRERFQVVSGGSEVTIQFQSDPDDSSFILSQGFLIHYRGKCIPKLTNFVTLWTHTYFILCKSLSHNWAGQMIPWPYHSFTEWLPFCVMQRLSQMTPVLPCLKSTSDGSARPTLPLWEAVCWPISANQGMTSVALTSLPVSGTSPGAAAHLLALKVRQVLSWS